MRLSKGNFSKILSILLCLTIVFVMAGCSSSGNSSPKSDSKAKTEDTVKSKTTQDQSKEITYKPGTYKGSAQGKDGEIQVEVTVDEHSIKDVKIVSSAETKGVSDKALAELPKQIVESQSLGLDAVSGASLTSKGILDAVTNALQQSGADVDSLKAVAVNKTKGTDEEITADVVVIGGGASGTAAALSASEKGAKVVILEKSDTVGGAGLLGAEGLLAYQSKAQKAAGQNTTVDQGFETLMNYTHNKSNAALTRAIYNQSASTIDWLAKYGVATKLVPNTQEMHQKSPLTYHKYVNKQEGFKNMYANLEKMGAKVYTNTTGKELIKDANGAVTGVIAEKKDGGKFTVHAKSVIVATGGFAGNLDMMKQYMEIDPTKINNMAIQTATGDGINMAFSAGAAEFGIRTFEMHAATVVAKLKGMSLGTLANIPLMWVNQEGNRFTNENNVYDHALWGNATYTAGGYYYYLLDSSTLKQLKEKGTDLTNSFEKTIFLAKPELVTGKVAPMKDIEKDLQEGIDQGVAWKGNTVADLAKAIGADPTALQASIDKYNQAVGTGKDTDFLTPAKFLKYKVSQGPFYAVKASSTTLGSIGGVRINEKTQAIDTHLMPIPGLYVCGNDAGGMYGDSYPTVEGLTLSFAYNSGRIAGYQAAAHK